MPNRKYSEQEQSEWREQEYGFDLDELEVRHWIWWNQLDQSIRDQAVEHLRDHLPAELKTEVRDKRRQYGDEWMDHMYKGEIPVDGYPYIPYSFHHAEGMGIRNLLRGVILDEELPSGNWDDFYVAALLTAVNHPFDQDRE